MNLCDAGFRPVRCGTRAALALERKLSGFVHCVETVVEGFGRLAAVCYVGRSRFDEGEDLGAFLIRQGLAVAAPDAPFEYVVQERIARANRRGLWGFQVDSVR